MAANPIFPELWLLGIILWANYTNQTAGWSPQKVVNHPLNSGLEIIAGWWFQTFFMFILKIGEDSHFDEFFSKGLVQPPTR